MPVGHIGGREGPNDVSASQSLSDMMVFRHIDIVTAGDEIKVTYMVRIATIRSRQTKNSLEIHMLFSISMTRHSSFIRNSSIFINTFSRFLRASPKFGWIRNASEKWTMASRRFP